MSASRLLAVCLGCVFAVSNPFLSHARPTSSDSDREKEIAGRFSPIFYQALGDKPHSDYITNFDFDGDWQGDNNWEHAEDPQFILRAFIYYSVAETNTHFFIQYAVFHPRDYKGGENRGTILSELIHEGMKRGGKYDPTGLGEEVVLAHENDMEGCLVVVSKNGQDPGKGHVAFVETLHHSKFSSYVTSEIIGYSSVRLEGNHPLLYIEPKGHGIEAFSCDTRQCEKRDFLRYKFTGTAGIPEKTPVCRNLASTPCHESLGYELLPIATTLWSRAQSAPNETYGEACDYSAVKLSLLLKGTVPSERKFEVGKIGCAFLGAMGGPNMARPPWAWFDLSRRDRLPGSWFFDPASVVKGDFELDKSFSTVYMRFPFWALTLAETPVSTK